MLNIYIPQKLYSTIVFAGIIVLVLYVIRMLLRYFVQYYGHAIGVKMQPEKWGIREPIMFYIMNTHQLGRT